MNQRDLDDAYTQLCRTMTALGEDKARLFLARFALLALARELDPDRARSLIADASAGLAAFESSSAAAARRRGAIR